MASMAYFETESSMSECCDHPSLLDMESTKTVEIFYAQVHHMQSKSCNGAEVGKTESSKFGTRKREYQVKGSSVLNKSSDSFLSNYENDRRKKKCKNSSFRKFK